MLKSMDGSELPAYVLFQCHVDDRVYDWLKACSFVDPVAATVTIAVLAAKSIFRNGIGQGGAIDQTESKTLSAYDSSKEAEVGESPKGHYCGKSTPPH